MPQTQINYNLDLSQASAWLTVTASQTARASIAYVQELGDFYCGPGYYTSRENLPSYLIKLCLDGEGRLNYGGREYAVRPGQLFWIDCMNAQHYATAPGADGWRLLWAHFYGAPCEAYYRLFLAQGDGCPVVNLDGDDEARQSLERLFAIYRDGGNTLQDDVRASALLTRLMARCVLAAGQPADAAHLPGYVKDARAYIDRHYAERITLERLSRAISISKFYLQKLFKQHMGLSPNEYLTYTRLTHAKRLLRTSAHPISRIAQDVGVNNIGHFVSLFKKYEGVTPGAYRRYWDNLGEGAPPRRQD